MRLNMPVTTVERFVRPDAPIVTETDTKGVITYANPAFIEISGFEEHELVGKAHNVVRHPDMPAAAFDDLWRTLKAGRCWHGLVKNRAKNGDFYWVDAYVSPIRSGGSVTGYRSVRTRPAPGASASAEALYRDVRDARRAFPATPVAPIFERLNFATRGWATFGFVALAFLAFAAVADSGLSSGALWAVALGLAVTVLIAGGWWIANTARSVAKIEQGILRLAEGNFRTDVHVEALDEFAGAIGAMETLGVYLRAVISDIIAASARLTRRSEDLDRVARELRAQTDDQTNRVMQVSASTEQMSAAIGEINHATQETARSASRADEIVGVADARMRASIASTQRIVVAVGQARSTLDELRQAVDHIGNVTKVIHEIADQTNLLALNAAIEAARAGEQGRGFAVVADEVRKLAERTSVSTREIGENIDSIRRVSESTFATMDEAVAEVGRSTADMEESGHHLAGVAEASRQTVGMTGQMADSLAQQSAAATDVAQAMEAMNVTLDQTDQRAGAVFSTAEALLADARALRALMQHFEKHL